jgi:hypothetical protein
MNDIDLFQLLEDRRIESEKRSDILHKRIGELRDEMANKMDDSHREIMHEIKELRKEQQHHAKEMSQRVSSLERWRWLLMGGAAVLGFILAGGLELISNII